MMNPDDITTSIEDKLNYFFNRTHIQNDDIQLFQAFFPASRLTSSMYTHLFELLSKRGYNEKRRFASVFTPYWQMILLFLSDHPHDFTLPTMVNILDLLSSTPKGCPKERMLASILIQKINAALNTPKLLIDFLNQLDKITSCLPIILRSLPRLRLDLSDHIDFSESILKLTLPILHTLSHHQLMHITNALPKLKLDLESHTPFSEKLIAMLHNKLEALYPRAIAIIMNALPNLMVDLANHRQFISAIVDKASGVARNMKMIELGITIASLPKLEPHLLYEATSRFTPLFDAYKRALPIERNVSKKSCAILTSSVIHSVCALNNKSNYTPFLTKMQATLKRVLRLHPDTLFTHHSTVHPDFPSTLDDISLLAIPEPNERVGHHSDETEGSEGSYFSSMPQPGHFF